MIIDSPLDLIFRDLFMRLRDYAQGHDVHLKLEGFSISGSIKIKTAIGLICDLEERGGAVPGKTTIVESSSGNLGVALSLVCKQRGYRFICVTDPNTTRTNVLGMKAYGAEVIVVSERDENGGYLKNRFAEIDRILRNEPDAVWLNQYANPANKKVHSVETAEEVLRAFRRVDWLFVGAGTTGTFMGCAETLRRKSPHTTIVVVEPVGSVIFGSPPSRRHIPGLGASDRPALVDPSLTDYVLQIEETATVRTCRDLVNTHQLLVGGSTGTVLSGVSRMAKKFRRGDVIVAISPDLGDKYLDTVYDDQWVKDHIGEHALNHVEAQA